MKIQPNWRSICLDFLAENRANPSAGAEDLLPGLCYQYEPADFERLIIYAQNNNRKSALGYIKGAWDEWESGAISGKRHLALTHELVCSLLDRVKGDKRIAMLREIESICDHGDEIDSINEAVYLCMECIQRHRSSLSLYSELNEILTA
jgi:hypothetical protein